MSETEKEMLAAAEELRRCGVSAAEAEGAAARAAVMLAHATEAHIFNTDLQFGGPTFQRRLGFFYIHEINPATIKARSAWVERLDEKRVRVHYEAVVLPEGADPWSPLIPPHITDENGNWLTEQRSLDALWEEVTR